MFRFLFFVFCCFVCVDGLSLAQRVLRRVWRDHPPANNPFVALIETPLHGPTVAYTAADNTRIYLDSQQLEETPNALWNVLRHEVGHTQGQQHGDDTVEMKYHLIKNPQGRVVEDSFRI